MTRQISGLHAADHCAANRLPDGVFIGRVPGARFQKQAQKPYYTIRLIVLEPSRFAGHDISSRLYCNPKALWKLNWFLRDFGYASELLGRDEVDQQQLTGLQGVAMALRLLVDGESFRLPIWTIRKWPEMTYSSPTTK